MQAKLNLNIEAEPVTPTAASTVAGAPTFTEKPKIETLEGGKRVQMIVRYKAEAQCQCQWFFKETKVVESTTTKVVHEKRESYYECRLEMTVSLAVISLKHIYILHYCFKPYLITYSN